MKKIALALFLISLPFVFSCTGFERDLTFSGTPDSGPAPLTVDFGCNSDHVMLQKDAVETYSISPGDGSDFHTGYTYTYTYETPGTYSAICFLEVVSSISGQKLDGFNKSIEITVTEPGDDDTSSPVATIEADPDTGAAPVQVYFTGNVTGGDAPLTYAWDFDDGGTSSSQNPTHTFTSEGTYNVTFTVTDNDGDFDSDTIEIEVGPESDLEAIINVVGGLSHAVGEEVSFSCTVTGGTLPYVSYVWVFGDGNPSTFTQNTTHTYDFPGEYTVYLWVSDSANTTVGADPVTLSIVPGD